MKNLQTFKPIEKYDYYPTAVNSVVSTSESVFLNTRDRSSYSSNLMKFDNKLIEQGSVKIPSFSYYPDMLSFGDSVYILAHKRNNELSLITIGSNLESVKTGEILSDLCKPSSPNDNYKLTELNGELLVVEIKKNLTDNLETNTITIISLKEKLMISKTEISKINNLNIKLTDKYLFIGGDFEKILKVDNEVFNLN
ncbi:MAG: hypothetical protein HC905_31620 [Bacteroidales bacterium]|nr:hypothetical protein [Bacteroidales bacterium]